MLKLVVKYEMTEMMSMVAANSICSEDEIDPARMKKSKMLERHRKVGKPHLTSTFKRQMMKILN